MPVGTFDINIIKKQPIKAWFDTEYNQYQPNFNNLNLDTLSFHNLKIKIFAGSWCSDTRMQLPRFIKILKQLNYDINQLEFYFLDENKSIANHNITEYNISKVPTFIFYKNGVEIGRIIESPIKTLEIDMINIIQP